MFWKHFFQFPKAFLFSFWRILLLNNISLQKTSHFKQAAFSSFFYCFLSVSLNICFSSVPFLPVQSWSCRIAVSYQHSMHLFMRSFTRYKSKCWTHLTPNCFPQATSILFINSWAYTVDMTPTNRPVGPRALTGPDQPHLGPHHPGHHLSSALRLHFLLGCADPQPGCAAIWLLHCPALSSKLSMVAFW